MPLAAPEAAAPVVESQQGQQHHTHARRVHSAPGACAHLDKTETVAPPALPRFAAVAAESHDAANAPGQPGGAMLPVGAAQRLQHSARVGLCGHAPVARHRSVAATEWFQVAPHAAERLCKVNIGAREPAQTQRSAAQLLFVGVVAHRLWLAASQKKSAGSIPVPGIWKLVCSSSGADLIWFGLPACGLALLQGLAPISGFYRFSHLSDRDAPDAISV